MKTNPPPGRREFLRLAAGGVAASLLPSLARALPSAQFQIKAVAFDGFAIFDPRPIFGLAGALFPGRGLELANEWRTRQFEYTWLRTVAGHYADFSQVSEDALAWAADKLSLTVSPGQQAQLLAGYLSLKPWPDVPATLGRLQSDGLPLAILSNLTPRMMQASVASSRLQGAFQSLLSTDQVQAFKPDPGAYALGPAAFSLRREEILFVASAGWDAAGAKLFGYPTYWVNRPHLPAERLGASADATAADLDGVAPFLLRFDQERHATVGKISRRIFG